MSNVLIVPEKNEGMSPLKVVEEGLKSKSIDQVYIIDGWSTDNTVDLLNDALPVLARRYRKEVELSRSRLRNTGKGGAMVTGMEIALEEGHSRIVFVDADVSSVTSGWFDYLVHGMDQYNADMTRGYFDRSPFDAQITRHITIPAINMFFPEGRGISQPLGGELCLEDSLARYLLEYPMAPPHTWGIDTFMTVTSLVGGFKVVELYLSQKLHKGKKLRDLEDMLLECFDEIAKLMHFHGRDRKVPVSLETRVVTVPKSDSEIERVGVDVRTLPYTDLNSEVEAFFESVKERELDLKLLGELGIAEDDEAMVSKLLRNPTTFLKESGLLDGRRWVQFLDTLFRGYVKTQFSSRYRDILVTIWRLRALAFCVNEADSFDAAEENSRKQADYAFELYQARAQTSR